MIRKVALGLSGGIDSAVTVLQLMDAGYEVIGITMSIYDPGLKLETSSGKGCFGPNEPLNIQAAAKVAAALGIEHHVIRLQEEFTQHVLEYYRQTYMQGLTPNPCAMCNSHIKFGFLPAKAKALGLDFDYFATGHYVRRRLTQGRWQLYKGVDPGKDQSYFLALLSQKQLEKTLFPLGEFTKEQTRAIAQERGLDFLLSKGESQDFIQSEDHASLFDPQLIQPGEMVDSSGKILARHRGIIHYTIGQRKGLGISGQNEPVFVTGIDASQNKITIGTAKELYHSELICLNPNWLSITAEQMPSRCFAKIRQQHQAAACTLQKLDDVNIRVIFDEPQLSITPGQIVAFYDDELLLGGGIIQR